MELRQETTTQITAPAVEEAHGDRETAHSDTLPLSGQKLLRAKMATDCVCVVVVVAVAVVVVVVGLALALALDIALALALPLALPLALALALAIDP